MEILDLEVGGTVARDEDSEDFWSAWRHVHCPMVIGKHGFFSIDLCVRFSERI